ncbi:hypothetical protein [Nocardiopsis sp. CC223A]|uniref:DUF6891 domain-containing protein n=1 Tax=Nocardiopsis sp. CC223A TaxID=3044051 RepID=UPI00278C1660|nr:hypothetical protein [Nocardiopsis sp. CC223A]
MDPRFADLDPAEVLDPFYSQIRQAVDMGEETYDEIVERVIDDSLMIDLPLEIQAGEYEALEGVGRADLRAWLVEVLRAEFVAHREWQRGLTGGPTDAERLTEALYALEEHGIVAREDFACCQRCGLLEIRDEGLDDGSDPRGYVFYHEQDTGDDPLHLTFDTPDDSDEARTVLGGEVVGVLLDHGLSVEWNGDPDLRIKVRMSSWRTPRHGELAVFPEAVRATVTGDDTPILREARRAWDRAPLRTAPTDPLVDGAVEADGFHFTVTEVRDGVPALDQEDGTLAPQGRFVVVGLTVHNPKPVLGGFSPAAHVLHDTLGRTHTFHQEATLGHALTVYPRVFSGPGTILAGLVFDLPRDAVPSHLMVNGHARADLPEPLRAPAPATAAGGRLWAMVTAVRTDLRTVGGVLGNRTARGRYVVVGVALAVRSSHSMELFPTDGHVLHDADGNAYEVDREATHCFQGGGTNAILTKGVRTETVLVFDVPDGAVPDRVRLAGPSREEGLLELLLPVPRT